MIDPWVAGYFEGNGHFCREHKFLLEARSGTREPLDRLADALGGQVYGMPSRPNEFTWRLMGTRATATWLELREHLSEAKRRQGDAKLARVNGPEALIPA